MQTVTKLIKQYKAKVAVYDEQMQIIVAKRFESNEDGRRELNMEYKIMQAQRQCYYQMIEDLKDVEFDSTHC